MTNLFLFKFLTFTLSVLILILYCIYYSNAFITTKYSQGCELNYVNY